MGTAIVLIIVLAVVGLVIFKMVKDKKAGKTSCGCGCKGCANSGLCHSKK